MQKFHDLLKQRHENFFFKTTVSLFSFHIYNLQKYIRKVISSGCEGGIMVDPVAWKSIIFITCEC